MKVKMVSQVFAGTIDNVQAILRATPKHSHAVITIVAGCDTREEYEEDIKTLERIMEEEK
ncbi:MAG: hypothetical protein IKU30_05765 [Clostridia bacterium]|nr:hypothetical protein [Clostridia bacterium]